MVWQRDNDWCALGDWEVNEEKIKGGLPALAERIHGLGLKFELGRAGDDFRGQ